MTTASQQALVPAQPRALERPLSQDLIEFAKLVAASRFFSDVKDHNQAIAKAQTARELGLGPMAGIMGLYVVKGRVTLSANLMATVVQKSGRFNFRVRKHTRTEC